MLTQIRSGLNSFLVLLLMGLLIASFAVWGIGDVFRGGSTTNIAQIGDRSISQAEFLQTFQNEVRRQRQQIPEFSNQLALAYGLDGQILNSMMQRATMDIHAQDLGLRAGDDAVRKEISDMEAFKLGGRFDLSAYQLYLKNSGLNEKALFEDIRGGLTRELLVETLRDGAVIPQIMANLVYLFQFEKREVTLVSVPASAVGEIEMPEDSVLKEYFEENKERYQTPEYRVFDYALLTADLLAKELVVDDDMVKTAYEARKSEFNTPELRRLDQVVFADEADAEAFAARLMTGEEFAAAAESVGFSAEDTALGDLANGDLESQYGPSFADSVFALEEGAASEPLRSAFGWHVVLVTRIEPGREQAFEDVAEELRETLRRELAIDQLYDTANAIDDELAAGATLEEVAKAFGLQYGNLGPIAENGVTPEGSSVEDISAIRSLLPSIFAAEINAELELIDRGDQGSALLQVKEIIPSRQQEFEEVRERVVEEWRSVERGRRTKALAEELADKARAGGSLRNLGQAAGYTVTENTTISRDEMLRAGNRSQVAMQMLFQIGESEIAVAPNTSNTAYLVIHNQRIIPAEPSDNMEALAVLRSELAEAVAEDTLQQYIVGVQRAEEVEINQALLTQTREQLSGN